MFLVEQSTDVIIENVLSEIHHDMEDQGKRLTQHISNIKEDVLVVAELASLRQLIEGVTNSSPTDTIEQLRRNVEGDFTAIMRAKQSYLHVRYIDAKGDETVRVDRKRTGSPVYTVPKHELQYKAHRDYVQDTFALGPGEIYVSNIELYKEHGVIVEPHQIGSRVSMPLYDPKGSLLGMVIINFEVGDFLRQMESAYTKRHLEMFITNSEGDYLIHPDHSKRFGFMYGKRFLLQQDLPPAEAFLTSDKKEHGFQIMETVAGEQYIYMLDHQDLDQANPDSYLVSAVRQPYAQVVKELRSVYIESLQWGVLVVFIAAVVALLFGRRLISPLQKMTDVVDKYTHGAASVVDLPTKRTDEIGVLARSFSSMIERVEAGKDELEQKVEERTQELIDSQSLQKAIFSSMSDAVLTTLENGEIKEVNHAAENVFGVPEAEIIGTPLRHFISEHYYEDSKYLIGYCADGSEFPAEVEFNQGKHGDQPIFTTVVRDVSERLANDKLKNEFVSTVSHELRTPLTAIKGGLELMAGNVLGEIPDRAKPVLEIACNNANRLLVIVNDLLDMQKIAEGKMEYNFRKIDVASFVQQAVINNHAYADQYNVKFKIIENASVHVSIKADENRLMQVMSNLLSNAAKFSPKGGDVEISVQPKQDNVWFYVTDHGSGIPESFRSRMFTKFSQADSSDTRQKGGSGLGLAVSKSIIENHAGIIGYDSREGEGTTFHFCIPLLQET